MLHGNAYKDHYGSMVKRYPDIYDSVTDIFVATYSRNLFKIELNFERFKES